MAAHGPSCNPPTAAPAHSHTTARDGSPSIASGSHGPWTSSRCGPAGRSRSPDAGVAELRCEPRCASSGELSASHRNRDRGDSRWTSREERLALPRQTQREPGPFHESAGCRTHDGSSMVPPMNTTPAAVRASLISPIAPPCGGHLEFGVLLSRRRARNGRAELAARPLRAAFS